MFLKKVKVKRFAESRKKYGPCPFKIGVSDRDSHWREVVTIENEKPGEIYSIVGVTSLKEGWSEFLGNEDGYGFRQVKSRKVYIVAKGLGRRFKVLPEDVEIIGEDNE